MEEGKGEIKVMTLFLGLKKEICLPTKTGLALQNIILRFTGFQFRFGIRVCVTFSLNELHEEFS